MKTTNIEIKLENGHHDDDGGPEGLRRESCEYKNLSERFTECSKDFSKQYAHIYAARLNQMRDILTKNALDKWNNKYPIKKLCDLQEGKGETCIIIGTLFKHQDLKPSILKELSEELQLIPQPKRTNFVEDSDYLILEDELQRIRLSGDIIDVTKIVTGVVCAVLGYENVDGMFKIQDYCWPSLPIQRSLNNSMNDDRYIVLASGFNFSSIKDNLFAIQLFSEWISGTVGEREMCNDVAKIVRLIIAGNSISGLKSDSDECGTIINTISNSCATSSSDSLDAIKKFDGLLNTLCQSITVDIMPGEFDPTNIMLPQKPMHYCMFPQANRWNTFTGVPNPYECQIEGLDIIGSSGQPVADILRYSTLESNLEVLRNTLIWGHIAPTAPDTLPCIPLQNEDPFILKNCPQVYFTGNADKFETELFEGENGYRTRLICVPSFAATRTIAIVNLKNLDCFPLTFMVNANNESMYLP